MKCFHAKAIFDKNRAWFCPPPLLVLLVGSLRLLPANLQVKRPASKFAGTLNGLAQERWKRNPLPGCSCNTLACSFSWDGWQCSATPIDDRKHRAALNEEFTLQKYMKITENGNETQMMRSSSFKARNPAAMFWSRHWTRGLWQIPIYQALSHQMIGACIGRRIRQGCNLQVSKKQNNCFISAWKLS